MYLELCLFVFLSRVARHGTEVDPLISAISWVEVTSGGQLSDGRSSGMVSCVVLYLGGRVCVFVACTLCVRGLADMSVVGDALRDRLTDELDLISGLFVGGCVYVFMPMVIWFTAYNSHRVCGCVAVMLLLFPAWWILGFWGGVCTVGVFISVSGKSMCGRASRDRGGASHQCYIPVRSDKWRAAL